VFLTLATYTTKGILLKHAVFSRVTSDRLHLLMAIFSHCQFIVQTSQQCFRPRTYNFEAKAKDCDTGLVSQSNVLEGTMFEAKAKWPWDEGQQSLSFHSVLSIRSPQRQHPSLLYCCIVVMSVV